MDWIKSQSGAEKLSETKLTSAMPIIIDFTRVPEIDFSAAALIVALTRSLKEKDGRTTLFFGASRAVEEVLQGVDKTVVSYLSQIEAENKLIAD